MFDNNDWIFLGLGGLVLGAIVSRLLNVIPSSESGPNIPVTIQDVSDYAKDAIEKQKPIMTPLDKVLRETSDQDSFGNGFIRQIGIMDYDRNTPKNDYYVKINSPMIYNEVE